MKKISKKNYLVYFIISSISLYPFCIKGIDCATVAKHQCMLHGIYAGRAEILFYPRKQNHLSRCCTSGILHPN